MRRARALVGALALATISVGGCSDQRPAFCEPLEESVELDELTEALESGDLELAAAEARRLADLAEQAPTEIRTDLRALTVAVVDIVDLLGEESPAAASTESLNERLGELDRRSTTVSDWALEQCGLDLT